MQAAYVEWVARIDEQTLRANSEVDESMRFRIQPFAETLFRLCFELAQRHMKAGKVGLVARECCHSVGAVSVAQVDC